MCGSGICSSDKRHTLAHSNGSVGDKAEHGRLHTLGSKLLKVGERNSGNNRHNHLLGEIDYRGYFAHHLVEKPRLHGYNHHIGSGSSLAIYGGGANQRIFGRNGIKLAVAVRTAHGDSLHGSHTATCNATGDGSAHVSGTYNSYLHSVKYLKAHA